MSCNQLSSVSNATEIKGCTVERQPADVYASIILFQYALRLEFVQSPKISRQAFVAVIAFDPDLLWRFF